MLQAFNPLCDPSLDSLQNVHVSLALGNPELGAAPTHLSKAGQRGAITCLNLLANPLPRAAQGAGGHFGHNGTLLVSGQLRV